MRVLITGATGFVGSYLMEHYVAAGDIVIGTEYLPTVGNSDVDSYRHLLKRADIRYREQLDSVVGDFKPDLVYHLAAQSYPALSWEAPSETIDTNIKGTANLFEALKHAKLKPTVIVACSSAQYGLVEASDIPVLETHPMRPLHPYGVSKLATETLAYQYFKNDGIPAIAARIFNTTGPRKQGDVCADFTHRAVLCERGTNSNQLRVGNLETRRAITDVRDLMKALILLSDKGSPEQAYNISGAKCYRIGDVLNTILSKTRVNIDIVQAPELMRPSDEAVIFGDSSRLIKDTSWTQSVSLDQTLSDMLDYWRRT
jgi:GDP-4-dehydro-6-deoxy-D-mannose reductase